MEKFSGELSGYNNARTTEPELLPEPRGAFHIGNTGGRGSAMARETMNYGRGLGFTGVGSGERGWLGAERVQQPKEH